MRIANAADIKENISRDGNKFTVESVSVPAINYQVTLCNEENFPSCSCADFEHNFLPCKRMLAIINAFSDISWDSLPAWYRNSYHRNVDECVVFTKKEKTTALEKQQSKSNVATTEISDAMSATLNKQCNHNIEEVGNTHKKKVVIDKITSAMSQLRNVIFDVKSLSILQEAEGKLQDIQHALTESCTHDGGLRVVAETRSKVESKSLKRKRNFCVFSHDELPRKYPKKNPYAFRVGSVANSLKPLRAVATLYPVIAGTCCVHANNSSESELSPEEPKSLDISSLTTITPRIGSINKGNLRNHLLKNGPYSLSMLHIKSIETVISRNELAVMKSHDQQFTPGWLYDMVIDSFLYRLCLQKSECLFVDTATTQLLQRQESINRLWINKTENTTFVFIPWNPSGMHWILLAVHVISRKLLYLDPIEQPCIATSVTVAMAKRMVDFLMKIKYQFVTTSVEAPARTFQKDLNSCGVYVCMYAASLANDKDLCQLRGTSGSYRKEVYDKVAGNCLVKSSLNKNKCRLCLDSRSLEDWVACTRCEQWYHCACIQMTKEEAEKDDILVCP